MRRQNLRRKLGRGRKAVEAESWNIRLLSLASLYLQECLLTRPSPFPCLLAFTSTTLQSFNSLHCCSALNWTYNI